MYWLNNSFKRYYSFLPIRMIKIEDFSWNITLTPNMVKKELIPLSWSNQIRMLMGPWFASADIIYCKIPPRSLVPCTRISMKSTTKEYFQAGLLLRGKGRPVSSGKGRKAITPEKFPANMFSVGSMSSLFQIKLLTHCLFQMLLFISPVYVSSEAQFAKWDWQV